MIYLDYQATTPLAPEVAAAMRPWLDERFANPHSSHRPGREAAAAVEVARQRVREVLEPSLPAHREGQRVGAHEAVDAHEAAGPLSESNPPPTPSCAQGGGLYFTSGATEAINWALKGAAARLPPHRRRIVTLATEHAAVLDTVEHLLAQGFDVEILPVAPDGLVDLATLEAALAKPTGLVAAMLVNNEIGVIQPVERIGALARAAGALFLCDAVQGFGRVAVPLAACDLVAISAHKVYGPKGIGALWVRDGVEVDPLLHGGGQEGGLRSGTLSPALCVGFGEAARLLVERADADRAHVERLWDKARAAAPAWTVNGSSRYRYRGNLSLRREGIDAARLISELRAIAFSAGSACASGSGRPSHVLAALGLGDRQARSSIRLGFGRYTTEDELGEALTLIDAAAGRQLSFAQ
ncbi:MAG TPA: cysteine desulfurase family protein [Allosphingosinicella sp.]|nr:cysteine desulfurase family protein [Allosphingosinicella sp.]